MRMKKFNDWSSESFNESLHTTYFKNEYYEAIKSWELLNRLETIYGFSRSTSVISYYEKWGDGEIGRLSNSIKDIIDLNREYSISYGGKYYFVKGVYKSTSNGTPFEEHIKIPIYKNSKPYMVCIPTYEISFIIHKFADEWYYVMPTINYGIYYYNTFSGNTISYNYLCNGFDGLVECLKDILK